MNKRMIPEEGVNPYVNHPGFDAQGCPLQRPVTRRGPYGQVVAGGFGCCATGGHCLPGQHCPKRIADCSEDQNRETKDAFWSAAGETLRELLK
jgi:hypothetical protein